VLAAMVLAAIAGCAGPEQGPGPSTSKSHVLTVDFQQDQVLRYKFVSSRKTMLNWTGGSNNRKKAGDDSPVEVSEQMEMIVAYKPVKVDPFGLTTIKAKVESVKARRTSRSSKKLRDAKDAVKSFAGKSFVFTIGPNGKIADNSQLEAVIKQAGEKAFRPHSRHGRIKEPDMIGDFMVSQWFLWDSTSSIENPADGVSLGQSWKSQLSLPLPVVMREARDVEYTLSGIEENIEENEADRVAVIGSTFSYAESVTASWPNPYPAGSFQISGTFGLLRRFEVTEFQGKGEELFNIDKGLVEQYNHSHRMKISAALMLPLPGANPQLTINQKLSMKLLGK
jgi:hypothetical protein